MVVDADNDPENGIDGVASLRDLAVKFGPLPPTSTIRTPRGGFHLLFAPNRVPLKNTASQIAPGVDIRDLGGYVIAPGCNMPDGRAYRIVRAVEVLPPLPGWFIGLAAPPAPAAFPAISASRICAPRRLWAVAIQREAADIASTGIGGRNVRLYLAACRLSRFIPNGLEPHIVRTALLEAAMACGLPEAEARASIKSAFDWRARSSE
jgi:hypothetical protein